MSEVSNPTKYTLPDPLSRWPWKRTINPHHEAVEEEIEMWMNTLGPFDERIRKAMDLCECSKCGQFTVVMESRSN